MQYYTEVDVEVSMQDVVYGASNGEKQDLLDLLVDEGFTYARGAWAETVKGTLPMDDPAIRLDAINYLRNNGWKVESA